MDIISNEEYLSGTVSSNSNSIRSLEERVKWLEQKVFSMEFDGIRTFTGFKNKLGGLYEITFQTPVIEFKFLNKLLQDIFNIKEPICKIYGDMLFLQYRLEVMESTSQNMVKKITLSEIYGDIEKFLKEKGK